MKKLTVIHTTSKTIDSLNSLIKENIEDIEVVNILDDSILGDMIQNKNIEFVEQRWIEYAKIAEQLGSDAVLSACSSVGEIAEKANDILNIPVYRIDDAMAIEAVQRGNKILVMATLGTTLNPTVDLIKRKSEDAEVITYLIDEAYEYLKNGDVEKHNKKIFDAVNSEIANADVVVLAQASMANALNEMKEEYKEKILTSPELGIKQLKNNLEK